MSASNYRALGVDKQGGTFSSDASPLGPANQRYSSENGVASSVITLTDNTTVVGLTAVGVPAVFRWVASTDTQASVISAAGTANFDDVIPANTTRIFPVPQERQGVASIVGAGVQAGLYRRIAYKTAGIGSVLAVEF